MSRILSKKEVCVVLALIGFVAIAFFVLANPGFLINMQLLGKNLDNPESDAAFDLSNGTIKCFQVRGFIPYIPSAPDSASRTICNKGKIVTIFGTSDALHNKAHGEAQTKAIRYAKIYNRYVVSNI